MVIWEQGAKRIATRSMEQLKMVKWNKEQKKSSGSERIKREQLGAMEIVKKEREAKNQKGAECVR